jgi:hypothetical protein
VVSATIALPLLPADRLEPVLAANDDVGETVGWSELVATVERVHDEAPPGAVILGANYGVAGAVDRFGPALGLPPAYSGHNGYAEWDPPPGPGGPVVAVGFRDRSELDEVFLGCRRAATIRNSAGVENEEAGAPVFSCRDTRARWHDLWPSLRRLG